MNEKYAHIHFKIGSIEVDCEGHEDFLKSDLVNLSAKILETCLNHKEALNELAPLKEPIDNPAGVTKKQEKPNIRKSTNAIAKIIGAKDGPGLVLAAAAHFHFTKGQNVFTIDEIRSEAKTCTSIIPKSFVKNLSKYLDRFDKNGSLNALGGVKYALTQKEINRLEGLLLGN